MKGRPVSCQKNSRLALPPHKKKPLLNLPSLNQTELPLIFLSFLFFFFVGDWKLNLLLPVQLCRAHAPPLAFPPPDLPKATFSSSPLARMAHVLPSLMVSSSRSSCREPNPTSFNKTGIVLSFVRNYRRTFSLLSKDVGNVISIDNLIVVIISALFF